MASGSLAGMAAVPGKRGKVAGHMIEVLTVEMGIPWPWPAETVGNRLHQVEVHDRSAPIGHRTVGSNRTEANYVERAPHLAELSPPPGSGSPADRAGGRLGGPSECDPSAPRDAPFAEVDAMTELLPDRSIGYLTVARAAEMIQRSIQTHCFKHNVPGRSPIRYR
jgi:hypothetical protein